MLVLKARKEYFQVNLPHFNNENSSDLMGIFQNMIESTSLLGSEIFEIQETWMGWCVLEYAYYALKTLLKGLKFFCAVSPSESPKALPTSIIQIHSAISVG